MEPLRQYVLSVISIAVLSGTVMLFFQGSSNEAIVKLVAGLIVTITVLNPLLGNPKLSLESFWREISIDGERVVRNGARIAGEAEAAYIKDAMESYISSKGKELGVEISTEIILQDGTVKTPEKVILTGEISPYLKKHLGQTIESDLGISEERQIWISRN